jgi:putative protease
MKIKSPLNSAREVGPLIEAGANEFYVGFVDTSPNGGNAFRLLNRRANADASVRSAEELRKIVELAHQQDAAVFVTFNEHSYSESQRPGVTELLYQAAEMGVDGVIAADPGLMLLVQQHRLPLRVAGGVGTGAFNSAAIQFYAALGVSRITLPRELRTDEIAELISRNPSLQYDVIVLNTRCRYIDSCCTFFHPLPSTRLFCRNIRRLEAMNAEGQPVVDDQLEGHFREHRQWDIFCPESEHAGREPCGLCALPALARAGVASLKIAGRSMSAGEKVRCVTLVRRCIELLQVLRDEREYSSAVQQWLGRQCGKPYLCYFPDVL